MSGAKQASTVLPLAPSAEFPRSTFTQLSAANVAPTAKRCKEATVEWQESVFLHGPAEFDDEAEAAAFEPLRQAGARLLGCSPRDIAGGTSCTELLASLAWGIPPSTGSNIVGAAVCFPSTFYPFARVAEHTGAEIRLAPADDCYVTSEDAILELIDSRTAIVAISHVEFTSGQLYDLPRIAEAAHAVGAKLIVDGTQSVGMLPIDVGAHAHYADAIAIAGYKWLCGAFGGAFMYVSPALQTVSPGMVGFRSHEDMWETDARRLTYPEGAKRFEFATMHFGSVLGLAKSIELLLELGMENIWRHGLLLGEILMREVEDLPVSVISPQGAARSAIVSFRVDEKSGVTSKELAEILQTKYNVIVSNRGPFLRVSPHIYNGSADIYMLVDALRSVFGKRSVL